MVYTFTAIITSILVVGTAAPILAAPVEPRIDFGISSVNNRAQPPVTESEAVPAGTPAPAPEAAAKEKPSGVGPAAVRGPAAGGVEVEAGAETGTAQSGGFLHSPIAQDLLGRAALAAISSILRREPEFADSLGHEPAAELEARSAIGSAITGGAASGAGFTATNNLIQHPSRAGGTVLDPIPEGIPLEIEPDSEPDLELPSARPASSGSLEPEPESDLASPSARPASSGSSSPGSLSWGSGSISWGSDWGETYTLTLPPSTPSAPSTGIVSKISSLSTPAKVVLGTGIGLAVGGIVTGAVVGSQKAHRDLDADTLHLLGRDLISKPHSILPPLSCLGTTSNNFEYLQYSGDLC